MYRRFWVDRDPHSADGVLSPKVEWAGLDEIGLGGTRVGIPEVGQFFREWLEVWEATTNEIELEELTPDVIVVISYFHGRARTTGLEFEREIGQVYEFEGGLAVRQTMYATGEEARAAARSLARN
jgi:hypothetical protein